MERQEGGSGKDNAFAMKRANRILIALFAVVAAIAWCLVPVGIAWLGWAFHGMSDGGAGEPPAPLPLPTLFLLVGIWLVPMTAFVLMFLSAINVLKGAMRCVAYVDFERLYYFVLAGAFFVTRAKTNIQSGRLESRPVEPGTGVRSDQVVWLSLPKSIEHYPDRLRRVSYRDPESGKAFVFLTNNFDLPASDHRPTLQEPLAGGIVLQMGQAEFEDQTLFRHERQRGQDASLDCHLRLRAGGDRAQGT